MAQVLQALGCMWVTRSLRDSPWDGDSCCDLDDLLCVLNVDCSQADPRGRPLRRDNEDPLTHLLAELQQQRGCANLRTKLDRLGLSRTPSPGGGDHRPPVEDSYDVCAAIKSFAQTRSGTEAEQRAEDLATRVRCLQMQARALSSIVERPNYDRRVQEHYARVRDELLAEAMRIEPNSGGAHVFCADQ
uniref:Uncharacterized protein n=1 Tax=Noctiluca scintillans TaxID=2966 RepID=A0A7S0ZY01_NOCSC